MRVVGPDLLINIHIAETKCTLSLDASGESLHRRGYRQEALEAPLNEVLAAGIILMTGWRGECDFIDPMCGSGTLPIEAALIARNIAPGVFRKEYAFEHWPDFDADLFDEIYNDDSNEREFTHRVYGYDNNPRAIEIATRNVKAAGLSKCITLNVQPFQTFEQPAEKAIIVTNPPYGERISAPDLLGLYQMIGERLKHAFAGGTAWILSYRDECFDQIGLKPTQKVALMNGALNCQLRQYELFEGKYKQFREEGEKLDKPQAAGERPKAAAKKRPFGSREERKQFFTSHTPQDDQQKKRRPFGSREQGKEKRERPFAKGGKPFAERSNKEYKPRSGESYPERKRREAREKGKEIQ